MRVSICAACSGFSITSDSVNSSFSVPRATEERDSTGRMSWIRSGRSNCREETLTLAKIGSRERIARTDLRQRQRLVAAIAAARFDPRYPHRAVALLGGARHAKARIDRIAGDGKPGTCRPDADADSRTRHRIVAGRFRHRPFVAGLSA